MRKCCKKHILRLQRSATRPINEFDSQCKFAIVMMIMVNTVQQALCPFSVMCFIIGLGFYPRKQSKIWWTAYLSILYSLIIWFIYFYILYYIITFFTIKVLFRTPIAVIVTIINIFTLIVSVVMSFYHQKV